MKFFLWNIGMSQKWTNSTAHTPVEQFLPPNPRRSLDDANSLEIHSYMHQDQENSLRDIKWYKKALS